MALLLKGGLKSVDYTVQLAWIQRIHNFQRQTPWSFFGKLSKISINIKFTNT